MYFILKYIDYPEFNKNRHTSKLQMDTPKIEDSKPPLATRGSKSRSLSGSKQSVTATPTTKNTLNEFSSTSTSSMENKEVLVNPECYLGSILDYICEVIGLPRNINFTMCTTTSEPLTVSDSPLGTSGLELFVPKETYYVVLKDYDESGSEVLFPLLHNHSEMYLHLMSKLNNFVEYPKKQSATSSSSSKLKPKAVTKLKEITKSKSRVKSATSQKEGKTYNTTLPPIKQRN